MNAWQNDKLKVAQLYDDVAGIYERAAAPLAHYEPAARAFLANNVRPGCRLLDLGCGPGHLTSGLPLDVAVAGIDISSRMVDEARQRRPAGTYLVHDFHQPLPAELGHFDAIMASGSFDFCEDLTKVINNVVAALALGGRFCFMINERRPELPFHGERWIEVPVKGHAGKADVRIFFWTFSEAAAAIEASGLRPLTYQHAAGWEIPAWHTTIHYGYWVVERPRAIAQAAQQARPSDG